MFPGFPDQIKYSTIPDREAEFVDGIYQHARIRRRDGPRKTGCPANT